MKHQWKRGLAVLFALAALSPIPAVAEPIALTSGRAQLPTSGLVIDLPPKPGITYNVSASWSLDSASSIFDARDVIDELDASGTLRTGNWVQVGYFNAGNCTALFQNFGYDNAWTATETLWGESWEVLGGVNDFGNALGRRPAAALCRSTETGFTLLMQHFLVDQPETAARSVVSDSLRASGVLANASTAFSAVRVADISPLRRSEVRNRGKDAATRTVKLPVSGLVVDLPDDGYLWLVSEGIDTDMLDRLLPAMPEVSVELMLLPEIPCEDFFVLMEDGSNLAHRPLGLPAGWAPGPAVSIDGLIEMTMCHDLSSGALAVGVFQDADNREVTYLHPLLAALQAAAERHSP